MSSELHPKVKELLDRVHGGVNRQLVQQALSSAGKSAYTRTGAGVMARDPRLMANPPDLSDIKNTKNSGHLITPFRELQAEFAPKNNLMPSREADIEQMQREGAYIVPLVGDKSRAGTILLGHHGTPLVDPVDQQGGPDYSRTQEFAGGNDPTGWRSRQGAAKSMQGRIQELAEKGFPIYGAHVSMGHKSADSSHHMLHAIINQIPNLNIADHHVDAFDEEMRKKFPQSDSFPMPWPGIRNPKAVHDFFYRQPVIKQDKKGRVSAKLAARPGSDVTKFVQNMDSVRWQSAGFPSVASARFATTVPELFAEPQLSTGYSISKLDPSRGLMPNDEMTAHGTYTHGMPSLGYAGRFKALVPADKLWEGMLGAGKTLTAKQHSLMTKFPAVKVDLRVVDLVKKAAEDRKKEWGFNRGGVTKALKLTAGR